MVGIVPLLLLPAGTPPPGQQGTSLPTASPAVADVPDAAPDRAPEPDPRALTAALAPALAAKELGPRPELRVVDAATGTVLDDVRGGTATTPASTTKLATAAAALTVLGPESTLMTRLLRAGSRLVLVGGGDPTLAGPDSPAAYPPAARLADLAAQAAATLGRGARVSLAVDDRLFSGPRTGPGWKPVYVTDGDVAPVSALELDRARLHPGAKPHTADERAPDPALQAGQVLAGLLRARGVAVAGAVTRAPGTGIELARVSSPPVRSLVQAMLASSDNDLAEALGRAVALRSGRPASFDGAAGAVTAAVAALGVRGIALHDTSGLSPLDTASPQALVDLIRLAVQGPRPELRWVLPGLPVAGFDGTLADRFRLSPSGLGAVRAKTGTLQGVGTLAGLVQDTDGRLLAFAVAAPGSGGRTVTQRALDRVAGLLAGCGCR